jgi:tRNA threonylcarbamoyladenosine biosynthesis protein TsaE
LSQSITMRKQVADESGLLAFAAALATVIMDGTVLFLYGPLGAGKTTFTRGLLRGLGYHHKVKSPTYTLVETYAVASRKIFHFDLYRLNDPEELLDIGLSEYFSSSSICVIEWPEKGFPLLPQPDLACYIAYADSGREISVEAYSDQGKDMLRQWDNGKPCGVFS